MNYVLPWGNVNTLHRYSEAFPVLSQKWAVTFILLSRYSHCVYWRWMRSCQFG